MRLESLRIVKCMNIPLLRTQYQKSLHRPTIFGKCNLSRNPNKNIEEEELCLQYTNLTPPFFFTINDIKSHLFLIL